MDSAAIEQMNKLRKSLGLPLLGVAQAATDTNGGLQFKKKEEDGESDEEPASTIDTREAAGYSNFQQIQDEKKKQLEQEQRKKAIQKARDAAARFSRLEGKGLGDLDDSELDAKAWLKGQKKRQKHIDKDRTRRLEEELAERERLAAVEYKSSDLAGVQVAHEVDDFGDDNGDQILTLKDREIGEDDEDDEGDVLENADLVAKGRLQEKLDAKKRIRYDVHDDEKKALLSQYDDKKRKAFTLDAHGSSIEERDSKRQAISEKLKNAINLDTILKPEAVSDYLEIKIKKPKKTNKKNKRVRDADEDEIFPTTSNGGIGAMDVDPPKPRSRAEMSTNDDEDLSNALNFSRKAALKKKKLTPEDMIRQLKEEPQEPENGETEGGIVLDDTTSFLTTYRLAHKSAVRPLPPQPSVENGTDVDESARYANEDQAMPDSDNQAYTIVEGDEEALLENLKRAENIKRENSNTPNPELSKTGLQEEQTLDNGIGAALNLLKSRGIVQETDSSDRNTLYRNRQKFIHERQLRENDAEQRARAQRERDRVSGKNVGLSQREREEKARYQNEARSQQQSVAAAAAFNKEYKPDVELRYVDDTGRRLNQKEAFKHLSHQFHGKGSGKGKTEKHLKKIEEEKRDMAKSVLDNTGDDRAGGMQRAQGTMGRRDKVAGVRLG